MPAKENRRTLRKRENAPLTSVVQEEIIYSWNAPARPFKRRSRDFYVTLIAVSVLVGLILFLIEGFMPVLLLIALVFLFYVLSTIPPDEIEYHITSFGIRIGGELSPWDIMGRFWFGNRFGSELLIIEADTLGGRLEIIVPEKDKAEITQILADYLLHEKVPASNLDKAVNWFSQKLPNS